MKNVSAKKMWVGAMSVVILAVAIFSLPTIFIFNIQNAQERALSAMEKQFPVTVDPRNKTIVENERVNAFLESPNSPLQASVWNVGDAFRSIFTWIAVTIADAPLYQSIAATDGRLVHIT